MNAFGYSHKQALAVFAHELREPLTSILFAARMLADSKDVGQASREHCAVIERQGQYAARLIEGALEVCRADAGKIHLHADRFDLRLVARSAVETINPLLTERKHRLALFLPLEPIPVTADALRLQQVLVNLLANATKHTPVGGQIQLSMSVAGDFVLIQVHDDGSGISPELLPSVFDLYRQGEPPSSSAFAGLGIGLALVRSLVELHGGSVIAHSSGAGTGSTFEVRLPLTQGVIHAKSGRRPSAPRRRPVDYGLAVDARADA